jgi:hypothetical protein
MGGAELHTNGPIAARKKNGREAGNSPSLVDF